MRNKPIYESVIELESNRWGRTYKIDEQVDFKRVHYRVKNIRGRWLLFKIVLFSNTMDTSYVETIKTYRFKFFAERKAKKLWKENKYEMELELAKKDIEKECNFDDI